MTLTQARVPKGTPMAGGQFTATAHRETGTALVQHFKNDGTAIVELGAAELLAAARTAVDYWAAKKSRGNVDVFTPDPDAADDLAQDAIVDVLQYQADGTKPATAGWVSQMAHNAVVGAIRGDVNATDAKARRLLDDVVTGREQELGRHLTGTELDQAAANLRHRWADPRHKPSFGFHRAARTVTLTTDQVPEAEATFEPAIGPGTKLGLAIQAATGDHAGRIAARRLVWDAIAEATDAPTAAHTHSARHATAMRLAVEGGGGVLEVAAAWERGEDTDATRALFRPFGDIDANARGRVVDMLTARSAYAEELWWSAAAANRGR